MRWTIILGFALLSGPALAADGWTMRAEPPGCFADRIQDGGAKVEIGVWPGRTVIGFSRPDLPDTPNAVRVSLRVDDGQTIETDALGFGHAYAVTVRPAFAAALRTATRLEFILGPETLRLDVVNAGRAMEDASRCAKLKEVPGMVADAARPLDDAPGWLMIKTLMGEDVCTARRPGAEGDTLIYRPGERGVLVIGIWRADWMKPPYRGPASIQIDNGAVKQVMISGGYEAMVWRATDLDLAMFKGAHTLTWNLPWGIFQTDVTGLPQAAESLGGCWIW